LSNQVLQMIRDFVLAPALLQAALLALPGAALLLMLPTKASGRMRILHGLVPLATFLLTALAAVGAGALAVMKEVDFALPLGWVSSGLLWGAATLLVAERQWPHRWLAAGVGAAVMALGAMLIDDYLVSALLFVE